MSTTYELKDITSDQRERLCEYEMENLGSHQGSHYWNITVEEDDEASELGELLDEMEIEYRMV